MDLDFEFETRFGTISVVMRGYRTWPDRENIITAKLFNQKRVVVQSTCRDDLPRQQLLPFGRNLEEGEWFRDSVEILHEVFPLLHDFTYNQENIVQLCVLGGRYAIDLLRSSPALAFYLSFKVLSWSEPEDREKYTLELVRSKRIDILTYMSMHPARWVVKLYNKIPDEECSYLIFRLLYNVIEQQIREEARAIDLSLNDRGVRKKLLSLIMNKKKIKVLRHLPQINRFVLEVMGSNELDSLFESTFYYDACRVPLDDASEVAFNLRELRRLMRTEQYNQENIQETICLKNIRDIHNYHERFVERLVEEPSFHYTNIVGLEFPPPPVPELRFEKGGKEWGIIPMTNGEELWKEGSKMHHCVASYAWSISRIGGQSYVYHVELPHENPATVLIEKGYDGRFRIVEIRGVCNDDVGDRVKEMVEGWLKTGQMMEKILTRVSKS